MEQAEKVNGILSIDSDTVPLGGQCIVNKFGWETVANKRTRVASILRREEVIERVRQRLEWPGVSD